MEQKKCDKCNGTGQYKHFGVCNQCKGSGVDAFCNNGQIYFLDLVIEAGNKTVFCNTRGNVTDCEIIELLNRENWKPFKNGVYMPIKEVWFRLINLKTKKESTYPLWQSITMDPDNKYGIDFVVDESA